MEEVIMPFVNDREARFIGCWAITEPQHGSDMLIHGTPTFKEPAAAASVRAVLDGDEWVINGQKSAWVSNGTIATHALCFLGFEPVDVTWKRFAQVASPPNQREQFVTFSYTSYFGGATWATWKFRINSSTDYTSSFTFGAQRGGYLLGSNWDVFIEKAVCYQV